MQASIEVKYEPCNVQDASLFSDHCLGISTQWSGPALEQMCEGNVHLHGVCFEFAGMGHVLFKQSAVVSKIAMLRCGSLGFALITLVPT
tara:strand:+ start:474 stop:740 length:267 start_codon:yes stop_codon:yes gene_type:complete